MDLLLLIKFSGGSEVAFDNIADSNRATDFPTSPTIIRGSCHIFHPFFMVVSVPVAFVSLAASEES
jgi:hypothetical protein